MYRWLSSTNHACAWKRLLGRRHRWRRRVATRLASRNTGFARAQPAHAETWTLPLRASRVANGLCCLVVFGRVLVRSTAAPPVPIAICSVRRPLTIDGLPSAAGKRGRIQIRVQGGVPVSPAVSPRRQPPASFRLGGIRTVVALAVASSGRRHWRWPSTQRARHLLWAQRRKWKSVTSLISLLNHLDIHGDGPLRINSGLTPLLLGALKLHEAANLHRDGLRFSFCSGHGLAADTAAGHCLA